MKKLMLVAAMLLAAGLLAVPAQVFALGGPHASFVCNNCHIPHASGGDRLWVDVPSGAGNWGGNKIGQLCYSCHDGTQGGSNMLTYIYTGTTAHGPFFDAIPAMPDGPAGTAQAGSVALNASGLPYAAATNPLVQSGDQAIQCTSCHFVHDNTDNVRPYLRAGAAATYRGDLCERCHRRGETDTAAEQGDGNEAIYVNATVSLHPVQIPATVQSQGAALVAALTASGAGAPNMGNVLLGDSNGDYRLGGKTLGGGTTGTMDCTTCHAVHGDEAAGTQGQGNYKLAIDNFPASYTTSALCNGCHVRPVVTGGSDHPIDTNSGAYAVIYPANGGPNHGSAVSPWPAGASADPEVVCSSCHDAHGGLPADASTNQGNDQTGRLRRTMGNATNWCYSCHANASPANHHSHQQNLNVTQGDPMTSLLTCESCHGSGTNGTFAHNGTGGFFATRNFGAGNHAASGVWCNYCHSMNPTDIQFPSDLAIATVITNMDGGVHDTAGGVHVTPNGHGVDRGEGSHILGVGTPFTFGPQNVVVTAPKTNAWANAVNVITTSHPAGGSIDGFADNLSRFGMAAATSTATAALVCESCHNIIGNVGYVVSGGTGNEGWESNLLLHAYEDDGAGNRAGAGGAAVDSELCMQCHYGATQGTTGPPGTHQITGQTITAAADNMRASVILTTALTGYANATVPANAPNDASYPNTNQMDCDSCHRPHDAAPGGIASASTVTYSPAAISKGVDFILEEATGTAGVYSPDLCVNCHAY